MPSIDTHNTEDVGSVALPLAVERPPLRRYVRTTAIVILLWLLTAWVLSGRYVDWQARQVLAEAEQKIGQDMADIATGLERNLAIFHGIPAIISRDDTVRRALSLPAPSEGGSPPALAERRVDWPKIPVLAALNTSLADSVKDVHALSVIWVINPAGDCIAASNSQARESFVGVNYADREYFQTAREGRQGRQFAVGRASKVPGLYFSAPVFAGNRFLGVVAGKIDLPYLASWVNQTSAFVTDTYGVIIQAQDKQLEMRALPGAGVHQLSSKERLGRYLSETINEISIVPWLDPPNPELHRLNGGNTPFLLASRLIPNEDLTVTVLQAVPKIATQSQDRRQLFALIATLGALLLSVTAGTLYFVNNIQRERRNREHQSQIEYLATHDALTGLFSRAVIDQMISHGIAIAARTGRRLAVLFMDMDMFKDINDSLGHESGDLVLQEVARRLRSTVRASDPVIRHGGDEFVILLHDLETPDNAAHLTGNILQALSTPFVVKGLTLNLSASLGVALYPDDGDSASILLRNADSALYRSKESGRSDFRFYHASMNADTMAHLALENEVREALAEDQFVLHYQPQYSLSQQRVIGCEALVRWQHPVRGLLSPGEFVAATEKSGLIVPLGEWVLREACRQASAWRQSGLIGFPVAVNLSAIQFRKPGLVDTIQRALADTGLPADGLELELTESALMENTVDAMHTLQSLKALGVGLSIDDFGTGYSSLAYLKRFEPDVLKIDRSFVRDIETDTNDLAIISAIIGLAHSLDYRVIAEGVETESQMHRLEQLGCHEIQGYWFSRPLKATDFAVFISQQR